MIKYTLKQLLNMLLLYMCSTAVMAGPDLLTNFTNSGGIINTRHNLTQSTLTAQNGNRGGAALMDGSRNNYAEVCVYCHTPHGGNTTIDLPLWNRSYNGNSYTTYDTLGSSTLTSDIIQPGINSLSCLSCHDGTLSVDSIINMPGSGGYFASQQSVNNRADSLATLENWATQFGGTTNSHSALDANDPNSVGSCLLCHNATGTGGAFATATDFSVFAIGLDLTNDHPVGIALPTTNPDFVQPNGVRTNIQWFDGDADNRPDTDEIRFYDTGSGPRVECASCHDPHGVAPGGFNTTINKSFLRISNDNSQVCLTCHIK